MFRLIHSGNSQPASFIIDPSAEFQAGMIAELTVIGNQVMATVSRGTAPIGIFDDTKSRSFTDISWEETVIVPATGVISGDGRFVTPIDIKAELEFANIVSSSFTSRIDVSLNPVNGVITFPAGTELNCDLLGTGEFNAIKTVVSYTYYVPNVPGDDTTLASGRVTVWYQRIFFQTDQYETNCSYAVRANLFVNSSGLLTTTKPSDYHPAIAMVTAPPSPKSSFLEALWY
jgi:hypothetical protein